MNRQLSGFTTEALVNISTNKSRSITKKTKSITPLTFDKGENRFSLITKTLCCLHRFRQDNGHVTGVVDL